MSLVVKMFKLEVSFAFYTNKRDRVSFNKILDSLVLCGSSADYSEKKTRVRTQYKILSGYIYV